MLQRVHCPDSADVASVVQGASPEAAALAQSLEGCCHPRAGRILARLGRHPESDELERLRAEVEQLLCLSFGPAEARRRLQ